MRVKLPTLLYYPCPCCGAPLFARAVITPQTLTTFQFCRKCAEVIGRYRRGWGRACWEGVRYGGGMALACAILWLLMCLFLASGGPE